MLLGATTCRRASPRAAAPRHGFLRRCRCLPRRRCSAYAAHRDHHDVLCCCSVYASENATGAFTSVASSFLRDNRSSHALHVWAKLARAHAASTSSLRSAVGRWHAQALAFAMTRLSELCANQQKLRHAVGALRQGALAKSVRTWAEFADAALTAKQKLKAGLRRMAMQELTAAFTAIERAADAAAAKAELHRRADEFAAPRKVMQRVLDFWSGRGALRRGGLTIAKKMMAGQQAKAWRQWAAIAAAGAAAKRYAKRILSRELVGACTRWAAVARDAAEALELLRSAAKLWGNRLASAALRTWHEAAAVALASRQAATRVAARFVHRAAAMAWTSWLQHADEQRTMRAAVASLRNGAMKKALLTWCDNALAQREQIASMRAAVGRLRAIGQARALAKWSQHVEQAIAKQARVQVTTVAQTSIHGAPLACCCRRRRRRRRRRCCRRCCCCCRRRCRHCRRCCRCCRRCCPEGDRDAWLYVVTGPRVGGIGAHRQQQARGGALSVEAYPRRGAPTHD